MKFNELDARMRVFETAHDLCVLPHIHMVARLDGRGFTRLTKEVHAFEAPYDERFRDYMVATTEELMRCGFNVLYGYTQSDEISLLFHRDEMSFGRKLRKLDSVLAGTASAAFSLKLGALVCFDCRISQLPSEELVADYFRWRSEDALRNALNAHCYWALRRAGMSAQQATKRLQGTAVADKNELLFREHGINFHDLPGWHKRGVGLYWEPYTKEIQNPDTGEAITMTRRRIKVDLELPAREAYNDFIRKLVRASLPENLATSPAAGPAGSPR